MSNPFEEISRQLTEIKEMLGPNIPKATDPIEIISRDELQKRLGITEPTVIRWTKRGKIPEMRIGSAIRYNWPNVVKALEAN